MNSLVVGLIWTLEGIFAVGMVGSGLVLVLSLIEDSKSLLERDKH
jgi:hypothetical protein